MVAAGSGSPAVGGRGQCRPGDITVDETQREQGPAARETERPNNLGSDHFVTFEHGFTTFLRQTNEYLIPRFNGQR